MDLVKLQDELKSLEQQRAKLIDGVRQIEGAIGFCKGLIAKATADDSEPKTGE